jgi:small-conductance mechanosensitive channel
MPVRDWLEIRYFDNTLAQWLIAAGVLVGGTVLLLLLRGLVVRRLQRLAQRTKTDIDDLAVDLIRRTRFYFIVAVCLVAGTLALEIPAKWMAARHVFIVIAVLLQLGVWGTGLITYWIERYIRRSGGRGATATTLTALGFLGRFVLWGVLLILGLGNLGFEITTLVTGLGIGGIAIALAVQNILGDLFGALSIVLDKPFVVGDFIVVDTFSGTVEHVGLKTTRLRALTGEQIVMSNAELLKSRIRNYQSLKERRQLFTIGVEYDTPPDVAARIPAMIREAVEAQPLARFDRSHFQRFGDSTLDYETVYYVLSSDYNAFMDTQQAINVALLRRFAEEGIGFAFPTRTVVLRRPGDGGADAADDRQEDGTAPGVAPREATARE